MRAVKPITITSNDVSQYFVDHNRSLELFFSKNLSQKWSHKLYHPSLMTTIGLQGNAVECTKKGTHDVHLNIFYSISFRR